MTLKEALDWCEQFTDNLVIVNVNTKKRTLGLQAMQTCKSALKKQIPKKPTHEATLYRCLTCPTCKNVIDEFMEFVPEHPKIRVKTLHCKYCGQALDWSDTE